MDTLKPLNCILRMCELLYLSKIVKNEEVIFEGPMTEKFPELIKDTNR